MIFSWSGCFIYSIHHTIFITHASYVHIVYPTPRILDSSSAPAAPSPSKTHVFHCAMKLMIGLFFPPEQILFFGDLSSLLCEMSAPISTIPHSGTTIKLITAHSRLHAQILSLAGMALTIDAVVRPMQCQQL